MNSRTFLVLVTLLIVAYGLLALAAMEPPLEDAFISFRCARNLVRGEGLVFNPGQRVEAMSNFLWTLLLAAFGGVFGNYLVASKILGFGFGALCLALVLLLIRRFTDNGWIIAFAGALLIGSPYFLSFSVYGLETPLQWFLLLLLLGSLAERRWMLAGFALGLLPACRPEGYFYLPPVLLLVWRWERGKVSWPRLLGPALGLAAALTLFRLFYYHDWLPNTVYAKSIALVPEMQVYRGKIARGLSHTLDFFLDGRFYLWLPVLCLGLPSVLKKSDPAARWAVALVFIQLVFVVVSGGNVFGRYRFLAAIYPLLCLAAAWGLTEIEKLDSKKIHTTILATLALLATLCQVEYERSGRPYWKARTEALARQPSSLPAFIGSRLGQMGDVPPTLNARFGLVIRESFPIDALIATGQIGQIGFYSERPILDLVGLADRTIAHEGGTLDYLLERNPALFLMLGSRYPTSAPNVGVYAGLLGTDEFRRRYEWTRFYRSNPPTEAFYWIERRQSPLEMPPRTGDTFETITLNLDG